MRRVREQPKNNHVREDTSPPVQSVLWNGGDELGKKDSKRIVGLLIIIAAVAIGTIAGIEDVDIVDYIITAAILFFMIRTFLVLRKRSSTTTGSKKAQSAKWEKLAQKVPAASKEYSGTEEAIHCAHSRGKQKYLEQIESFLANGIIDKEEYRLLKERYEKLDLPDDFH